MAGDLQAMGIRDIPKQQELQDANVVKKHLMESARGGQPRPTDGQSCLSPAQPIR